MGWNSTYVLKIASKRFVRTLFTEASIRTGIFSRRFLLLYDYMFSPTQLVFFTQCLSETRHVPGCCVEIGCAYGKTTVFLRKFMDESGIKKDYYALDTFSGFVPEHVDYEVGQRHKTPRIAASFATNKKSWFDYSLQISGIDSIISIECDAAKFDFDRIGPIAFALLDVDLYLPMTAILPKLYENLGPGGVILVDDCVPDEHWDGALAAYDEFVAKAGIKHEIVLGKIGIIRKPQGQAQTLG